MMRHIVWLMCLDFGRTNTLRRKCCATDPRSVERIRSPRIYDVTEIDARHSI